MNESFAFVNFSQSVTKYKVSNLFDDKCFPPYNDGYEEISEIEKKIIIVCFVTLIVLLIIISFCKFKNKFLAGFNFFNNAKYVFKFDEEKHPMDMPSLYGIRAVAMLVMIPGHGAFFRLFNANTDNESYQDFKNSGFQLFIGAAGIALCDVFFVSSAIVMTRYILSKLNKNQFNFTHYLKLIIHRYFRLAPALAFLIFTQKFILALKSTSNCMDMNCHGTWWKNLLFLPTEFSSLMTTCFFWFWYAAAEFHMILVAPVILYVLWNQRKTVFIFVMILLILATSSYEFYTLQAMKLDVKTVGFHLDFEIAKEIYYVNSIFLRASSYFIGMILGFLIYKWENKAGEKKTFSLFFDIFANFNLFSMIISMMFLQKAADFLQPSVSMQYLMFSAIRINWAILIGLFAVSNHFASDKNLMNRLLSLQIWRPFVKISYSVYLVHPLYQFTVIGATPKLEDFNFFILILKGITDMIASTISGFIVFALIEQPFGGIPKLILGANKKEEKEIENNNNNNNNVELGIRSK